MKSTGKLKLYFINHLICGLYLIFRSGVQVGCTCGYQSNIQTPITSPTIPQQLRDAPLKPMKPKRKRRACDRVEEEDTYSASYPDDFNEEKTQNDVNYSFTRSGTARDHHEKISMDRQLLQETTQDSEEKISEENPETFNLLNLFDEGITTFDLLCHETLKDDLESVKVYRCL